MTLDTLGQKKAKKKADAETAAFKYEIECAGTGIKGTYLVKVYSYSKKPQVAKEQSKKNAVHGILFKGFPAGRGCTSQQPLVKDPNARFEYDEFFSDFFDSRYMKFVSVTSDSSPEILKAAKKEYKVGIIVAVQKDLLRKDLEEAGVIKALDAGF